MILIDIDLKTNMIYYMHMAAQCGGFSLCEVSLKLELKVLIYKNVAQLTIIKILKVLKVDLLSIKRRCRSAYINILSKPNSHHDRQVMMHQARMKYFKDHKFLLVL